MTSEININYSAPVAIGGIGGSGTRLVANALRELGYYLGSDLNHATDNEWFAYLFRHADVMHCSDDQFDKLLDVFLTRMTSSHSFSPQQLTLVDGLRNSIKHQHYPPDWAGLRANSLCTPYPADINNQQWGWKEPNTHIFLDKLIPRIQQIKYIHVMRNGLDMAFSQNQNQLRLWGSFFLGEEYEINSFYSLKYWRLAHERLLNMPFAKTPDFLLLNFDHLCLEPEAGFIRLLEFLEVDPSTSRIESLSELVTPPSSIGRYREHETACFDPDDVAFVRKLGFDMRYSY